MIKFVIYFSYTYLVPPLLVRAVDDSVFLFSPRGLLDFRIEVIVPTFTTLLTDAALQMLGDQRPSLWTVLPNQLDDVFVFLLGPGTCDFGTVFRNLKQLRHNELSIEMSNVHPLVLMLSKIHYLKCDL